MQMGALGGPLCGGGTGAPMGPPLPWMGHDGAPMILPIPLGLELQDDQIEKFEQLKSTFMDRFEPIETDYESFCVIITSHC
jgi:hypothetical protein